ncbi:MAG TPA: peptide chain release factor N(5)-glutamine methyltransferase [Solirubrobacteraceae bacterium]|nr:peptide chain release factor N(5)-glutamine methyltransferase [Solirubrobacteraceae bacterium]
MPEVVAARPSIAGLLREATSRLAAGSDTPRLDAELLLAHALGVSRERLVIDAGSELAPSQLRAFHAVLSRREAREPVAYILGRKDFRRITLHVDRRVLIPRPETELLVEVGLTLPRGASVVDVGTGSGAVALALANERPDLEVWATDVDPGALEVARANGIHLESDVGFVEADLLDSPRLPARPAAVLANLPYVAAGADLPPDVARYEPMGALFAGRDGLDVIRRLVDTAGDVPLLALEVGFDQAEAVAALLAPRTSSIEIVRDLAGHDRVVVGRR